MDKYRQLDVHNGPEPNSGRELGPEDVGKKIGHVCEECGGTDWSQTGRIDHDDAPYDTVVVECGKCGSTVKGPSQAASEMLFGWAVTEDDVVNGGDA